MSYDLSVEYEQLPDGWTPRWVWLFEREGFSVELSPGFTPEKHRGGFVTMKLTAAPAELIGRELHGASIGGFEAKLGERCSDFRFGNRGPVQELAMMCVGAALLAEITGGTYVDPQLGRELKAPECLALAVETTKRYLATARPEQLRDHPWPGWAALGC